MNKETALGFYRHFDGPVYRVRAIGHAVLGDGMTETPGEPTVLYQAQYTSANFGTDHSWARPVSNFTETVTVDGNEVPRFTHIPYPELPKPGQEVLTVDTVYTDTERSIAFVTINGTNQRTLNHQSTVTYEVLDGSGIIEVDGVVHPLQEGTIITVPRETSYYDEGKLVMVATAIPPFDPAQSELL